MRWKYLAAHGVDDGGRAARVDAAAQRQEETALTRTSAMAPSKQNSTRFRPNRFRSISLV